MNRKQRRAEAKQARAGGASAETLAVFAAALARHRAGAFDEAEALYRHVLALHPEHPESVHYLGVLAYQHGRGEEAVALMGKAIALKGDDPAFHGNLGNALKSVGRVEDAIASYRVALALDPKFADAHGNLGNALRERGKLDEAVASYRRAVALRPDFADAHNNLGNALKDQGRRDEAILSYRRALAAKPDFADAHNNLGAALLDQGERAAARASCEQAIRCDPAFAAAHYNLGNVLREQGETDAAIASYERAIGLKPDLFQAHGNLGNALKDRGRLDAAAAAYRRALELRPDFVDAHVNLGAVLRERGELDDAAACFGRALALNPRLADAHLNLGAVMKDLGRLEEARASYVRALEAKPDLMEAHFNLGIVLKDQGRREESMASFEAALALRPDFMEGHSAMLMAQQYMSQYSNAALRDAALRYGPQFDTQDRSFNNDRSPERRLRVGYVSGDFRVHPVGFFLARVLETHDRASVETFCYSNDAAADAMTERLRAAADHWRAIADVSDADVAAMVARDGIDILVDLSGHTAKNRLPLFARRAAPVQVSWLGYCGATGLRAMDYLVMDEATAPTGAEPWCAEAIVRLPVGRFCYAPPDYAPAVADPPSVGGGAITFGSFNNVSKIGPDVIALWAAVLQAAPGSRLILKWSSFDDEGTRRRFAEAFLAEGIDGARLDLRGHSPHRDMLEQYAAIDVALDPFPFCGGLTSCEALWMGLPVVTLPGDRPASRQTVGFLAAVGLVDCAAESHVDYIRRAVALAGDRVRLRELRHVLRPRMARSPLCDGALFTPSLEAAFRQMWLRWSRGQPATPFDVEAAKIGQ